VWPPFSRRCLKELRSPSHSRADGHVESEP
jgi:hypothetical protein